MSKLLIPNTTQVPNVLLDKVMPILPAAPLKVLLAIARFTYGFQKRSDKIGFTQLAKLTGLKRRSAIRAANILGDLIHVKTGGPGRGANEYSLNLDITESQLAALSERCKAGSDTGVTSDTNDTSDILSQKVVTQVAPFQTNISKPIRERESDKLIPDSSSISRKRKLTRPASIPPNLQPAVSRIVAKINELGGTCYRDDKPDALGNLLARLRDGRTEAECVAVVEGRHTAWAGNDKMLEYFRPSTLFAEKHFEEYLQDAQRRGNGNGKSPDVKELGNGMVEIDGLTMSRETYERKYARSAVQSN